MDGPPTPEESVIHCGGRDSLCVPHRVREGGGCDGRSGDDVELARSAILKANRSFSYCDLKRTEGWGAAPD